MPQLSVPYVLTGADGTRAVIGNSDAAKTDPDWLGWLDPANGISISKAIRESADDLTDADGGIHGAFHRGRATIVLQGALDPNVPIATTNQYESKLRRACRAFTVDGILSWQPSGLPARAYWFRQNQDVLITGRRPKTFQVQLVSPRPFALAPVESSAVLTPGSSGELGVSSPISDPLTSAFATSPVNNLGDVACWPRFRIFGPITNPNLLNDTTGQRLAFKYAIPGGQYLDVYSDPTVPAQILLNGTTNLYSALDRTQSRWWPLVPGPNRVRLLAPSWFPGAQVVVYWRSAWE